MSLWSRIREWLSGSSAEKDRAAIDRFELGREEAKRAAAREEGLPPHTEEVVQPRQFPPADSGIGF